MQSFKIISYINVNSLGYKFESISELLTENMGMIFVAETKIDCFFINAQLLILDDQEKQNWRDFSICEILSILKVFIKILKFRSFTQ